MNIYLAGPMRGKPEFNFPLFHRAAQFLRDQGHEVFNPAEKDIARHGGVDISKGNSTGSVETAIKDHNFSARDAIWDDLNFIAMQADAIALLPGWENSSGVNAEMALAKFLKGAGEPFKFFYVFDVEGELVWLSEDGYCVNESVYPK